MAWFYGLGKFRKEQILTSGFVFSVLAKTMILVSLLNDIKLKIHIGYLTLVHCSNSLPFRYVRDENIH